MTTATETECIWRVCGSDCVTVTACACGKHIGIVMPMGRSKGYFVDDSPEARERVRKRFGM